ncbi:MAG TPA: class I SAM-dependent methyltransferase [Candidatus Kapabacteria bacterium]|nr:class I SAM-dependent methyltransferase [Candidatus Kapabacteria bacterium]
MIKSYQTLALNNFNKICDFSGKKVLELCAGSSLDVAREIIKRGAKKVITIDCDEYVLTKKYSENLECYNMDARKLSFKENEFDIVFGVAALEHLNDLDKVLAEIYRVLVKNGYVYLHGAPLWTCCLGHHVWVHVDGVAYEFNANNPIPPWGHLIYQKEEMKEYLESQNMKTDHAQKIVQFIYDSPILNRYNNEQIIKFLKKSKLTILKIEESLWGAPDKKNADILKTIADKNNKQIFRFFMRRTHNAVKNYTVGAIEVIMKKK